MLSTLVLATTLLAPALAQAQSTLSIFSLDEDQRFKVSAADQAGHGATCRLPDTVPCRLALSPGALRLTVASTGRSIDEMLALPSGETALKLTYHSPLLGWIGVAVLGEGALDVVTSVALFAAENATNINLGNSFNGVARTEFAVLGVFTTALAVAALVTGSILAGIGFNRAGPHAEIASADEAPAYMPSQPAPSNAVAPPPAEWQGSRSDQ